MVVAVARLSGPLAERLRRARAKIYRTGRWRVFKLDDEKNNSPWFLPPGPSEEILCSGRVGIRAPIRRPLPLLGSAGWWISGLSETHVSEKKIPVWDCGADWKVSALECSQFNRAAGISN
jgi:hypothetical protein